MVIETHSVRSCSFPISDLQTSSKFIFHSPIWPHQFMIHKQSFIYIYRNHWLHSTISTDSYHTSHLEWCTSRAYETLTVVLVWTNKNFFVQFLRNNGSITRIPRNKRFNWKKKFFFLSKYIHTLTGSSIDHCGRSWQYLQCWFHAF